MKKGFESGSALLFLSVIFYVSMPSVNGTELYEPCDLNDPAACKQYNSSAVICMATTPTTFSEEDGICNCKWNEQFPDEYDFNETRLNCVALVGSHCKIRPGDPRYCVENADCKVYAPMDPFGRCECRENFMEDYENGTRRCVERKLDHHELCEVKGIPSDYSCKSFYETKTTLACIHFNETSKWCDCEGNEYEINYNFHNSKCLGLVNSPCDKNTDCYETYLDSIFCNGENECECRDGFSANEESICIKDETIPEPLLFNMTCDPGNGELLPCRNYSDTVDCILVAPYHLSKCLCIGSEDFPNDYGYELDVYLDRCIALVGTNCESTDCVQNATCINNDGIDTCQCKEGYDYIEYKRCALPTTPQTTTEATEETTTTTTTTQRETTIAQTTTTTATGIAPISAISKWLTVTLIVTILTVFRI